MMECTNLTCAIVVCGKSSMSLKTGQISKTHRISILIPPTIHQSGLPAAKSSLRMPQAHQSATHLAAFHPLPTLLSCPELQASKFCGRSGYLHLGDEYHSLCEVCSSEEVKPPPWRSDWVRLVQNPRRRTISWQPSEFLPPTADDSDAAENFQMFTIFLPRAAWHVETWYAWPLVASQQVDDACLWIYAALQMVSDICIGCNRRRRMSDIFHKRHSEG